MDLNKHQRKHPPKSSGPVYQVPNIPSDSFPFTVGTAQEPLQPNPGPCLFKNSILPKYSFKSLHRQPIDPEALGVASMGALRSRKWNVQAEPVETDDEAEEEEEGEEEEGNILMAATGRYKRQESKKRGFSRPHENYPIADSNSQKTGLRVISWYPDQAGSMCLTDQQGHFQLFRKLFAPFQDDKDPKGKNSKPSIIDSKGKIPPLLDERTKVGSMFAQTIALSSAAHNSGPDGQPLFDHYSINEANARILNMLSGSPDQLRQAKETMKHWGDNSRQVSLNLNRAPDAPLLQGRHSLWVQRTNTSSGMFLRKESREYCPECVRSIPVPAARETAGRYRLCPHWREVIGSGYTETTHAFGGSQNCPFCGRARGTQSTRHSDACPFHMPIGPSTSAGEYDDGLAGDTDFKKLRADPKAFDDPTTTTTTPAPARAASVPPEGLDLNVGIVGDDGSEHSDEDDSGLDDDDWKMKDAPKFVPPPPPPPGPKEKKGEKPKKGGDGGDEVGDKRDDKSDDKRVDKRVDKKDDKKDDGKDDRKDGVDTPTVIVITNSVMPQGHLRALDAEDQATNSLHCTQAANVIKLAKGSADLEQKSKAHYFAGVRNVAKISPDDRQRIVDIEAAVKAANIPRPFWEPNTYINASTKDFSKDTDGSQRLPDNVLENATTIRPTLGQLDPAHSKINYTGPRRKLFRGNETWFLTRFGGSRLTYANWMAGTATFADVQTAAPMDTTAATHPTEFYIKDTLEGVNWYGDTGIMTLPGPKPPPPLPKSTPKDKNGKPIIKIDGKSHEEIGKLVSKYLHQVVPAVGTRSNGSKKTDPSFCIACKKQTTKLGDARRHQHYGKCWASWPGPGDGDDGSGPPDGGGGSGPPDGATGKGTRSTRPARSPALGRPLCCLPSTPDMTRKRKLWESVQGYVTDSEDERDFLPTAKKEQSKTKDDIGTPRDPSKSFNLGDAIDTKIFTGKRQKRSLKKAKQDYKSSEFISSTPTPLPNPNSPVSTGRPEGSESKKAEPAEQESGVEENEQVESPLPCPGSESSPRPSGPKKRKQPLATGLRSTAAAPPILPQKNLVSTHTSRAKSKPFVPATATKATTATKLIVSKTSTYKSQDGQDVTLEERKFTRRTKGKTPKDFTEVIESIREPGKDAALIRLYRFQEGEETGLENSSKKRKIDEENQEDTQAEEDGNEVKVVSEEGQDEEHENGASLGEERQSELSLEESENEADKKDDKEDNNMEEEEEEQETEEEKAPSPKKKLRAPPRKKPEPPKEVKTPSRRAKSVGEKEPEKTTENKTPVKPKTKKKVTLDTPVTDEPKPPKVYRKTPRVTTTTKKSAKTELRETGTETETPSKPPSKKAVAKTTKDTAAKTTKEPTVAKKVAIKTPRKAATKAAETKKAKANTLAKTTIAKKAGASKRVSKK
ncbi:hypothetical protein EYR41_009917 [Orbilia oligospora]|uniref:Uncharacterized protein n=1 Tax=Orbilia oligospora TaxID=2813651 RepID=A0A8H2HNW8_ORBOL|nr:hypothetical protein EYR41_009917 [Orbilia oligospora]